MHTTLRTACGLILWGLCTPAARADHRQPGSLLVYPEFDNRAGVATIVTVTNTSPATTGDVDVEFVYVGRWGRQGQSLDCHRFHRTERLTPRDTLSLITNHHSPQQERGYLYVFAKSPTTGEAIAFDRLVGSLLVVDGLDAFQFSTNPEVFRGVGTGPGGITDIDGDGVRDLDGVEYEPAPAEILVPRFLGQAPGTSRATRGAAQSELLLIALTGGTSFATTLDLVVYNDNEEAFSASHTFRCWDRPRLVDISQAFTQDFLRDATAHDPLESLGALEYGWFKIDGGVASSTAVSIEDPAFLALYVEQVAGGAVADAPFVRGRQTNGDLLPRGVTGDQ